MSSAQSNERDGSQGFPQLVHVMRRLLAPDGCPWDREQTLDTLKPYLLEESYELLEAIETGSVADHCEELGDLLMQIVFQAELRRTEGAFDIDDVAQGIADKLIRRHPHVFGDADDISDPDQVVAQWSEIKEAERKQKQGDEPQVPRALAGVPVAMPALARAQQLTVRAADVGFDWPDLAGCRAKLDEELAELDAAGDDRAAVEAELGDVLLAAVNLARKLGVDAEGALRASSQRFAQRFEYVEDELHRAGTSAREADLATMDALWNAAKSREK